MAIIGWRWTRDVRMRRHTVSTEGGTLRKWIAVIFCLQLSLVGCAIRLGGGSNANRRAERLAIEKGKLTETTDPVARTKSYIVIADILLSFASDAAREQARDDFHSLLIEYGRTIKTARETLVNSERPAARQGFTDFENGLRRQVRTLQDLRTKLSAADYEPLDQAIQIASSIREEMSNIFSRAAEN
jgi:hypothetical protein